MNLDEFLIPSSIGTPAGVSDLPSSIPDGSLSSTTTTASAIPIKQQQRVQADEPQLSRASAPIAARTAHERTDEEFGYIQRHIRKTSIDERRVCVSSELTRNLANCCSRLNDELRHRRKFRR